MTSSISPSTMSTIWESQEVTKDTTKSSSSPTDTMEITHTVNTNSDQSLFNTKTVNPNRSTLAWYKIWKALHRVRTSGQISALEFNIINGWGGLLCLLIHSVIYGTFFIISYRGTDYHNPNEAKTAAITCVILSWALVVLEIAMSGGYFLYHMAHPLVHSRGYIYIGFSSLGLFGGASFFSIITLIELGVIQTTTSVFLFLLIAAESCIILVIVYMLFEVKAISTNGLYRWTYTGVASWIGLIAAILTTLSCIDAVRFQLVMNIVINVGIMCPLLAILRYSYLSRNIAVSFVDWQRSVSVCVVCGVLTVAITVLHATVFSASAPSKASTLGRVFTVIYATQFTIGLATMILFGQLAGIVYFGLARSRDLDPSFVFLNSQPLDKKNIVYSARGRPSGCTASSSVTTDTSPACTMTQHHTQN